MTLFDAVSENGIFAEAIKIFYPAGRDPATLDILRRLENSGVRSMTRSYCAHAIAMDGRVLLSASGT